MNRKTMVMQIGLLVMGMVLLMGCTAAQATPPPPTAIPPTLTPAVTETAVPTASPTAENAVPPTEAPAEILVPQVVARYPHQTDAFTQGLVWDDGFFWESTGLYGASSLRRVRLTDGAVVQQVDVPAQFFAEGLAAVDGRLIQLTWRAGRAFVYAADSFEPLDEFTYEGQGWGLCYDGRALWMSDGSDMLTRRDAETFEVLNSVAVRLNGRPVTRLNELECVSGFVYANVWQTDTIVQIDPSDGRVVAEIDARSLLSMEERAALGSDDVLNGIAYDTEADLFYITGKRWPTLFAVQFTVP